ncbi:SusC/RagA family TonB-linked outer membrane protein [Puteibacter caeruleilacunae]|nr:SusC/RagA family TonB-linked outer membrane protein [Puteibacter caeruleilacunae]
MKKNEHEGHYAQKSPLKKLLLMAKVTLFLLLAGLLQVSANSYSQSTRINLGVKNATVIEIFDQIEDQSEFRFFYDNDQLKTDERFTLNFSNEKVEKILKVLFEGKNFSYEVLDRHILITTSAVKGKGDQKIVVKGKVIDDKGEPLPGVTVVVKGTTIGTVTDFDGNFTMENVTADNVLNFSFVGMISQELTVGNKRNFEITMVPDAIGLEEIVAVGYGSQKKINLTGSVGDLNSEAIARKPVTMISQALAGEISGVTVESNSGAPGQNSGNITIRGMGTFSGAGNNPLVLVDGVPSSLDNINPNDVKSISVLKDAASAAIYGSRAANGVILVETKRGETGSLTVNYNGYVGKQSATQMPDFVNSWEYAELLNEFLINSGSGAIYTDQDIAKFKSGEDPDNYPNAQHYDDLFSSGSGFQTSHNLSFTGGTEMSRYLFSVGYLKQDGLIEKNSFERYNFLLNFDSKLSEKLDLSVSLAGDLAETNSPAQAGEKSDMDAVITGAVRLPVTYAGRKSDGTYGWLTSAYPEAAMDSESFEKNKANHFLGNASLKWNIIGDLYLTGKVGYNANFKNNVLYNAAMKIDANRSVGPSMLTRNDSYNNELILEALLSYKKSFNDHKINALVGYNQDEYYNDKASAFRDNFPNNSLYTLDAGSADNMQNTGTAYEWSLQSFFGRVNYNYNDKYLLEVNVRYDGSSRFPKDNRFGFFPSVSGAWRVSEESFLQEKLPVVNNLKLRASWGKLGNQQIGNYPYQSMLSLGQDYVFGEEESLSSGAGVLNLPNTDITWETTRMTDIGLDISLFDSKLSIVVDYFNKTTEDILYKISTSSTLGMTPSEVNAGEVENKGWDFNIGHNNSVGDFTYGVTVNFSAVKNKVAKLATVERDLGKGLFVGESLQSIYGYVADGLFVDQADIDSYASQPFKTEPGFIRFKDISGPDGVPDGKVDANYDRTILGSKVPKYTYGATINAAYKGFDFLMQWGGTGGMKRKIASVQLKTAFQNDATPQRWMVDNRWTVENPDGNAAYPKFSNDLIGGSANQSSSFWLVDASYLRLKNVQVGYSLPSQILEKSGISKLRLYVSGNNLLCIDNFYKGWDPEATNPGQNSFYPFTSVFLFGVNATF